MFKLVLEKADQIANIHWIIEKAREFQKNISALLIILGLKKGEEREIKHIKVSVWRRKWQPTPVLLPRESRGWRSLVGCRLWGRTESDTTERLSSTY